MGWVSPHGAPPSLQVLAILLLLTAVAELALAFVEDTEQELLPAVKYTNPSLYIITWVRDPPGNVLGVTEETGCETTGPSSRKFSTAH